MNEFVRGMQARIRGMPAEPGHTPDYYEGWAHQHEKITHQDHEGQHA